MVKFGDVFSSTLNPNNGNGGIRAWNILVKRNLEDIIVSHYFKRHMLWKMHTNKKNVDKLRQHAKFSKIQMVLQVTATTCYCNLLQKKKFNSLKFIYHKEYIEIMVAV